MQAFNSRSLACTSSSTELPPTMNSRSVSSRARSFPFEGIELNLWRCGDVSSIDGVLETGLTGDECGQKLIERGRKGETNRCLGSSEPMLGTVDDGPAFASLGSGHHGGKPLSLVKTMRPSASTTESLHRNSIRPISSAVVPNGLADSLYSRQRLSTIGSQL